MNVKNNLLIFFTVLFIYGCGFSTVLNNNNLNKNNNIRSIKFLGDKNLVFFLRNNLSIIENPSNNKGYTITLNIISKTSPQTKNDTGIIVLEKVEVIIQMTILDKNEKLLLQENFSDNKTVNVTNNPSSDSEIKEIETKNIILNLINKLEFSIKTIID